MLIQITRPVEILSKVLAPKRLIAKRLYSDIIGNIVAYYMRQFKLSFLIPIFFILCNFLGKKHTEEGKIEYSVENNKKF